MASINLILVFFKSCKTNFIASSLPKTLEKITIPVIGIGAGQRTDGQIMVIHDLLGISCLEKSPKFVKDFLKDSSSIEEAISNYSKSVKNKSFPSDNHTFF